MMEDGPKQRYWKDVGVEFDVLNGYILTAKIIGVVYREVNGVYEPSDRWGNWEAESSK